MKYTFVSFNIRYDTPRDGENAFPKRLPFIVKKLKEEKPDVIGFQEVLQHVRAALINALPDYYFVGGGREADRFGESSLIGFLKNRFNLDALDTFWLSPAPELPGSRFTEDQSSCPRVCSVVTLTDVEGGSFRFYNCHTDHEGQISREKACAEILERIKADRLRADMPFILTGDFNALPSSPEIELLLSSDGVKLYDLSEELGGTFHNYGRIEPIKIDYIFTGEGVRLIGARRWLDREGELFLSDHYPISAEVELEKGCANG